MVWFCILIFLGGGVIGYIAGKLNRHLEFIKNVFKGLLYSIISSVLHPTCQNYFVNILKYKFIPGLQYPDQSVIQSLMLYWVTFVILQTVADSIRSSWYTTFSLLKVAMQDRHHRGRGGGLILSGIFQVIPWIFSFHFCFQKLNCKGKHAQH